MAMVMVSRGSRGFVKEVGEQREDRTGCLSSGRE
jgi:hypothetical protein